MSRSLAIVGALGFLAVALGAFGAHALEGVLTPKYQEVYQTAFEYHFGHTLALLGILALREKLGEKFSKIFGFFVFGIIVFSGSLYVLAVTQIKWLGMITPVGGLSFLVGWFLLFLSGLKGKG